MNEFSAFSRFEQHRESFFYNLGGRFDYNSVFGSFNAFNLGIGDFKNKSKRFINIGTGIKFPTLFQLYDPTYGNIDLLPEKSVVLDVGVERYYLRAVHGVVLFVNQTTGNINFVNNTYLNQGDYKSAGVEYYVKKQINANISMGFNYNYTYVRDSELTQIPFVPEHKFSYNFAYKRTKHYFDANMDYYGTQFIDSFGNKQPSYFLVNLSYSYELNSDNKINLSVNNLFDKDYQQSFGYNSMVRNILAK
jgi:vitamin B12 transporter